ncbi:MAG: right-handed parallel beta-helix repeat-containing protein, partial [Kiritimatiellae bacterium]|nr:right-handed parallel beta-helix repeat-containing protein [Kiritimatiellia bacterium]
NKKRHTSDNRITDCHIYDGGNIFHQAAGIWIGQSYNNLMAGNHVHDFYYSGISIGWTWGYAASLAHHNIVEHNNVHHIGIRAKTSHPVGKGPVLCDLGGIYTLGIQPGTVIRRNIFHDIAGVNFGWGIYFDEGTSEVIAEKNLVYKTTDGGFHLHYGKDNIVRNNIFAFGGKYSISVTRPEKHRSFIFRKNIVYLNNDNLLHVYSGNQADFNLSFDDNIYWNPKNKKLQLAKLSFEEWKEKGMDRHSIVASPLFINPEKYNFSFKRNSTIKKTGFVPFGKSLLDPSKNPAMTARK